MTKFYQVLCVILLVAVLVYALMDNYHANQANKYKVKWEEEKSMNENLQERINANMESDKQKAELEKTMDSSKDIDNLNYVPDANILMRLREDPV